MKHGKWFLCATCDIRVNNLDDCDFTIGYWGGAQKKGGREKALANKIAIADLKKREKVGKILN